MNGSKEIYAINSIFALGISRIALVITFIYMLKVEKYHVSLFLLIFIVIIESAAIISKIGIKSVEINKFMRSARIFPDDKSAIIISIENRKSIPVKLKWRQSFDNSLKILCDGNSINNNEVNTVYLKGRGEKRISLEFTAKKRGYIKIPKLMLQSQDILGIFTRNFTKDKDLELIVYPKLVGLDEIYMNRLNFGGLIREERPFFLDPIMFAGLREYTPDTPSKWIDWKASAHKDVLLSRIVESSSSLKLLIGIDMAGIDKIEKDEEAEAMFEKALSIAATIATKADEAKVPFGLVGNFTQRRTSTSAIIPPNRTDSQIIEVLETLAGAVQESTESLSELLNSESTFIPWGTTIIIIGNEKIDMMPDSISQAIYYPLAGSEIESGLSSKEI